MIILNVNRIPLYATPHRRRTDYGEIIITAIEMNGVIYPVEQRIGNTLYLGNPIKPFMEELYVYFNRR